LGRKSYGYDQYYLEGPSGEHLGTWSADTKNWIQAPDVEQANNQQQHEEFSHPEKQRKDAGSWRNSAEWEIGEISKETSVNISGNVKEGKQEEKRSQGEIESEIPSDMNKVEEQTLKEQFTLEKLPDVTKPEEKQANPADDTLTSEQTKALKLIASFFEIDEHGKDLGKERRSAFLKSTKFAALFKTDTHLRNYLTALEERVRDPSGIDQCDSGLCGVAAFLIPIAKQNPETYVKYALELAQTGGSQIQNLKVKASQRLTKQTDIFNMNSVDFVTAASLRIDKNRFFKKPSELHSNYFWTGTTRPSSLKEWFKEAGYQTKSKANILNRSQGKQILRKRSSTESRARL
jgi:hypothetical protein